MLVEVFADLGYALHCCVITSCKMLSIKNNSLCRFLIHAVLHDFVFYVLNARELESLVRFNDHYFSGTLYTYIKLKVNIFLKIGNSYKLIL